MNNDVQMFPPKASSLATLHSETLLNLIIKDKDMSVTIFGRLSEAKMTKRVVKLTQKLSLAKIDNDNDDDDISYDEEEAESDEEITVVKVKKSRKVSKTVTFTNTDEETQAMKDAKEMHC